MARGRLISKSLGSSRKFHAVLKVGGKLGEFCQVLFPLVVANTDDFGRMPGDAFTVKNVVLPSSSRSEAEFDRALDALQTVNLIIRYEIEDVLYLQVCKFDEHQPNLHKRCKSKFPEFPESPGDSGISRIYRPNLRELNLSQSNPEENPEPAQSAEARLFASFWDAYPKKKAKDDARKAWDKRHPTTAFLAMILAAIGVQRQTEEWQKDHGRYIPYPASWLNAGRWSDAPDDPVSSESETSRYNQAASDEAERLILANEERRTHGRRG